MINGINNKAMTCEVIKELTTIEKTRKEELSMS